jgi:asparagine synthase (glutamine-hydrolysing)
MCGIAGLIHPGAKDFIESFDKSIAHRGPDGYGQYNVDNVALIHRRLAIQDLSPLGAQPMFSADGRYVIIYNGEIYNHWEIREQLVNEFSFKSTSDTETLLYGFLKYGSAVLDQLNGIFAFAILEITTGNLFIARDPFGIKPLYYYHDQGIFLFSSEMKTFLEVPEMKKELNLHGLMNYMQFLWSPGSDTPLKKVKKLEGGHYLTINIHEPAKLQTHKYYEIPFTGKYDNKREEELINELDQKLVNAVRRQLLSDVPIGFFLSGGLDSSLIVAIAKKLLPDQRLKCFTIDTAISKGKEGFAEDLPYAKQVADHLDVDLQIIRADVDILNDFDKMIWHLDEPQADAAPLNVWNICKAARQQGYTVLLGGTGGDDLFSGYRRHKALRIEKYIQQIPHAVVNVFSAMFKALPASVPAFRRLNKLLQSFTVKDADASLAQYYSWLPLETNRALFAEKNQKEIENYDPSVILIRSLRNIPAEKNRLNQMLYWDMKFFLTDHNLNYTDKMSMAHAVEVRVPYLDKDLVAFSCRIPPDLKMKGTTTKYLLKKVAERYLPHNVIYRPKTGFGAPVRDWVTSELKGHLAESFSEKECLTSGIFNASKVNELIEQNRSGKIDASYPILALLGIQSWYRQFMANKKITYSHPADASITKIQ